MSHLTKEEIHLLRDAARRGLRRRGQDADPDVCAAVDLLAANLFDPSFRPARALAEHGLGGDGLRRRFVRQLGAPPAELLQEVRLETGRTLLADPLLAPSIEEVAEIAGFGSRTTFWRACRQAYGRPPSALRAAETLPEAA